MNYARFAIARAISGAPPATGKNPKVCKAFDAELMLFEKFKDEDPTEGKLRAVSTEVIKVFNTGDDYVIAGMDVGVSQGVDEVWSLECVY